MTLTTYTVVYDRGISSSFSSSSLLTSSSSSHRDYLLQLLLNINIRHIIIRHTVTSSFDTSSSSSSSYFLLLPRCGVYILHHHIIICSSYHFILSFLLHSVQHSEYLLPSSITFQYTSFYFSSLYDIWKYFFLLHLFLFIILLPFNIYYVIFFSISSSYIFSSFHSSHITISSSFSLRWCRYIFSFIYRARDILRHYEDERE